MHVPVKNALTEEEFKNKFSIDDFDQPGGTDFGIDDAFEEHVHVSPLPTAKPSDAGFSKLSRQIALLPKPSAEACEGYLNKKSPALFIKWQVRPIKPQKITDKVLRAKESTSILLQKR